MRQTRPSAIFVRQHLEWLAQFDSGELLSTLLDLYQSAGIYIVDKNQQVLYWSLGMETLSGIRREAIIGKTCLQELAIIDVTSNQEQLVELSQANGNKITLKQNVRILHDRSGALAGGIGLLIAPLESQSNMSQFKMSDSSKQNFHGLLSRSPAMQDVFQIIQNAAETEATVLVRGESGSGKELVAKAIHTLSVRHNGPFLAINCAALSSNLLESELFGHVRGAFTGAIKDHSGLFQRAKIGRAHV